MLSSNLPVSIISIVQCKEEVIKEFERKVKQMDKTYTKITNKYKSYLKSELNNREDNYTKCSKYYH